MTDAAVLPPGVIRIDSSGRRQYSVEYKRRLAQLTLEPGASAQELESLSAAPGQIEIALGRMRVRVTGPVDPALLETILTHLHRR